MQRIGFIGGILALGILVSPAAAQQGPQDQVPPTQQTQWTPDQAPPVPQAEPLPPPPPFPPMPKARPRHRWVSLGHEHRSRADHRATSSKHHTSRAHHRAASPKHRAGLAHKSAHRPALHFSKRTVRQCHKMTYKQIMRHSSCRALMTQDLQAAKHRTHHAAHRHKASHRRHHAAKRRRR